VTNQPEQSGAEELAPKADDQAGRDPGPLSRRYLVLLGGLLLAFAALGMGLALYRTFGPPGSSRPASNGPQDPRRQYTGPFRNVNPDVRYVAEKDCAGCHVKEATSFAQHPMGRSLAPVARKEGPPDGARESGAFQALGLQFRIDCEGGRVRHRQIRADAAGRPVAEQAWDVHYVIGSGSRGYSYLSDCDGYVFQTPISWYSQKRVWNLSPGFGASEMTGRAVVPACLFCHANRANAVEGSLNRYAEPVFDGHAIGCQRCHGPGELHVAGPGAGPDGIDPTIVNPGKLAPDLREAVCEQCHLQGATRALVRGRGLYDFRPGLPFAEFIAVFVRAADSGAGQKAIGQVEQMYESRCFQGRGGPGRLGCISCHDPHVAVGPAERVKHYRDRCLKCHGQPDGQAGRPDLRLKGCSLPAAERLQRSAADSCIDCHMPRYGAADIPHTAATDHRILRKGTPSAPGPSAAGRGQPSADEPQFPLVSFYRGRKGVADEEDDRCRGLAVVRLAIGGDAVAARVARHAATVLESALRRDPDDVIAGEALGYALSVQGRSAEGMAAFQNVLAKAPDQELTLVGAALMAEELSQPAAAVDYWRRSVAANPRAPGYRHSLARLLLKQEAWQEALPHCQAWVRLDPFSVEARTGLVQCLLGVGDKATARAEFARLEALAPTNLRELQIRFGKRLR
jgi:predicted CXXCH cytochrome family protein